MLSALVSGDTTLKVVQWRLGLDGGFAVRIASQNSDLVAGRTSGVPWISLIVKVGLCTSRLETRFKESSVSASV